MSGDEEVQDKKPTQGFSDGETVSEQYLVPKRQVHATVRLRGKQSRAIQLFLGNQAELHPGPERPSDVLNGIRRFIPAIDSKQDKLILLQRSTIMVLTVPAVYEVGAGYPKEVEYVPGLTVTVDIVLTLDDGSEVFGMVNYLSPRGEQRLQDFFNTEDQFIPVRTGEQVHLVNGDCIVSVSPA